MFRHSLLAFASLFVVASVFANPEVRNEVIISVKEQKLMLLQNGARVTTYPISTSKFGLGDNFNSMATPIGAMAVAQKIGDHAPMGAVFKRRRLTGEILKPNSPGRDPIMTRIIWLRGLENSTKHAFARCIYIHGTADEKMIGKPASYGCIRMRSKDVVALYSQLPVGAVVQVLPDKLPKVPKARVVYQYRAPDAPVEVGRSTSTVSVRAAAARAPRTAAAKPPRRPRDI
ncbi:hypothetical protein BH20VER1_BH20VER1_16350 [soil metagenome]